MIGAALVPLQALVSDKASNLVFAHPGRGGATAAEAVAANRIALITGTNPSLIPYWNREELAANDVAFTTPSPTAIERLRNAGVRWLYADNRAGKVSPALRSYVQLRHTTTDATIYEIR
jgi:hypothetical protein